MGWRVAGLRYDRRGERADWRACYGIVEPADSAPGSKFTLPLDSYRDCTDARRTGNPGADATAGTRWLYPWAVRARRGGRFAGARPSRSRRSRPDARTIRDGGAGRHRRDQGRDRHGYGEDTSTHARDD